MEGAAHADDVAAGLLHLVHGQQALQRLGRAGAEVRVVHPPRGTHEHLCSHVEEGIVRRGDITTDTELRLSLNFLFESELEPESPKAEALTPDPNLGPKS